MSDKKLSVFVKSTTDILWEGEADSISSVNSQGPFDILPFHSNFISVIEEKPIIIRIGKDKKEFTFSFSVMYAHSNYVEIYTDL